MNCFQICIFVSDFTTLPARFPCGVLLWIAFKFVSLCRILQPYLKSKLVKRRCELLSNLYLCVGFYNASPSMDRRAMVVNCFQICIFVSDFTTSRSLRNLPMRCELLSNLYLCVGFYNFILRKRHGAMLWIAFKFVSLCRILQQLTSEAQGEARCELLSNLYLCVGFYNMSKIFTQLDPVVNCFQICIFVSDFTTVDNGQHVYVRCELLSNLYLCVGFYNASHLLNIRRFVVNCFQICIFVSDFTTGCGLLCVLCALWIAFKFVSLCRILQQILSSHKAVHCCELLSNLYLCVGFYNLQRDW